jgi:T-complex protein 1 subunit delta
MKQIFLDFSGTIEETKLIDGLILDQKTIDFGAPIRIEKAKIGLIQFCISPPKTDVKKNFAFIFPAK